MSEDKGVIDLDNCIVPLDELPPEVRDNVFNLHQLFTNPEMQVVVLRLRHEDGGIAYVLSRIVHVGDTEPEDDEAPMAINLYPVAILMSEAELGRITPPDKACVSLHGQVLGTMEGGRLRGVSGNDA